MCFLILLAIHSNRTYPLNSPKSRSFIMRGCFFVLFFVLLAWLSEPVKRSIVMQIILHLKYTTSSTFFVPTLDKALAQRQIKVGPIGAGPLWLLLKQGRAEMYKNFYLLLNRSSLQFRDKNRPILRSFLLSRENGPSLSEDLLFSLQH